MASECDKSFATNYMLINPKQATLFDLFHFLFCRDTHKRNFIEVSESTEESFQWRRVIFVSIIAQKLLLLVSKPMSWVGSWVEFMLNLIGLNGNVGVLLVNFVKGKVILPDKTSAEYLSVTGNSDKRVELDGRIGDGDGRYFGMLCMMAAKVAYENKAYVQNVVENHWKMEYLGFYNFHNDYDDKATTQAFLLRSKTTDADTIIIAFKGSDLFNTNQWTTNFDLSWYSIKNTTGKIHAGHMKSLGLQRNTGWPNKKSGPFAYYEIKNKLTELLSDKNNNRVKFILTGHGAGGALAILFAAVLVANEEETLLERVEGVYTFGQPKVGDEKFGEFMEIKLKEKGVRYYRFVYCNDGVVRLPCDELGLWFKHFGTCVYYDRHYQAKVLREEPNKNYFPPLREIQVTINSFMEIIRSFTISHTNGKDYKEGWFLRSFRVLGLVFPGLSNHSTQDYVNATRLGSSHVFLPINDGSVAVTITS